MAGLWHSGKCIEVVIAGVSVMWFFDVSYLVL